MRLLLIIATLALAACGKDNVRPDLPGQGSVVAPEVVIVERVRYVPIPAHLTRPMPIAEGSIAQCFNVAAERKAEQVKGNARFAEIQAIQGTEVEP
jgi:hypothetical protein